MKEEMKKLLRQKLLLFILFLLCLLSVCFSMNQRAIYRFTGQDSEAYYRSYINEYEGEITEEKLLKLELIETQMADAENNRVAALEQVAYGKDTLNVQQIKQKLAESYALLDKKEAFSSIKDQVDYVMEDSEVRQLIDPLGWKYLLQTERVDYLLVLALLVMNISLFTIEYDQDMQSLSITMSKGKLLQFRNKAKAGILLSAIMVIMVLGMRDVSYALNYSLSNVTASLQSVPTFINAPYQLTLGVTYLLSRGIQLCGYLCFSACVWSITVFLKKFFNTFVMVLGATFLMNQLIEAPYIYMIPSPIAMMQGGGFFRGNEELILNKGTNGEYAIQSYIGGNKAVEFVMLGVTCCLVLFFVRIAYYKYCNLTCKKHRVNRSLILILLTAVLGGCNQKEIESTENGNLGEIAVGMDGGFLMSLNNDIVLIKDGIATSYIYSTDFRKENRHSNISLSGSSVCYLNWISDNSYQGFTVECYDSKTRDIAILYDASKEIVTDHLFGLVKEYQIELEDSAQIQMTNHYFFYNQYLYLIDIEQHLIQQDLNSSQKKVLLTDCWDDPVLIDHVLYYINKELDLCAYDLSTQTGVILDHGLLTNIVSCQQQLYFTKADEEGIFCYNDQGVNKVLSGYDTLLSANSKYIYIQQNQLTYYYNISTNEITSVLLSDIVDLQASDESLLVGRMVDGTYQTFQYDIELQQGILVS